MSNTYEEDLLFALKQHGLASVVKVEKNGTSYFSALAQSFPYHGSKIDWSKIQGSVHNHESDIKTQQIAFISFFDNISVRYNLNNEDSLYLGDNLTDFCLSAKISEFRKCLPQILSIPQHHYFMAENFKWCLVFSMEGDMDFAKRITHD